MLENERDDDLKMVYGDFIAAREFVKVEMITLRDFAQNLVDKYWLQLLDDNKSKNIKDKVWLGPRCRNINGYFYIEWNEFRQKSVRGKTFGKYIKKGRGTQYSLTLLRRHCESWQYDDVVKYEINFSSIRKKSAELQKISRNLNLLSVKFKKYLSVRE